MSAAIEVDAIVKTFGETRALDGVTFDVKAGEVLGLLGPNGAGKTTSINVLATLLRPDAGSARVAGLDVVDDADKVRQHIALTGQFAALDEVLTGSENLRLFGRLRGLDRKAAGSKADELLERFSLSDAGDRPVSTYSGGMRRRLDLAASLVVPASVLFLDEPTTGLDPRSRTELWDVVRDLRSDGLTIVLTTQYLEEADQLAERIVVIDAGDVVASGTPDELKAMTGGHSVVVIPLDPADGPALGTALTPVGDINVDERTGAVTLLDTAAPQLPEVVRIVDSTHVEISDLSLSSAHARRSVPAADRSLGGAAGSSGAVARRARCRTERLMSSLAVDSALLGARAVTKTARNPASIMGAILFPLLFFLLFNVTMRRIMEAQGFDYVQLLPSAIVVQAMLFAAISSAYYVADDRVSGVLQRLRSMPIHRGAPMLGRAAGDVVRAAVSLVVLLVVGVVTGMRFNAGLIWLPAYVGVALLFAIGAALAMGLLGYIAGSPDTAVSIATIPYLPLLMLSTAFVPVEDFPGWLQPFVEWQPVTAVIDALRALTGDGDITSTVSRSVGWSIGLLVVCGYLGARMMRRAS